MRILHLFDPANDHNGPMALALAAASIGRMQGISEEVWLFGSSQLKRDARTAGLARAPQAMQFVSTPLGDPLLLYGRLRKLLSAQPLDTIVECWSPRMFQAARILAPRLPRILRVTRPLSASDLKLVRATLADDASPSLAVAISATLRHHMVTAGIDAQRTLTIPPGIDLSLHQPTLRAKIRESWGLTTGPAEQAQERIVALIGDPIALVDAYQGIMATGLAEVSLTSGTTIGAGSSHSTRANYVYFRVLVHPHQHRLSISFTAVQQFRDPGTIIQDANVTAPWLTLPGCDAAIAVGQHASGLGLLHAMAAGVPIVAEATHANCEALEDQHNALLSKPGWLQGLSHNLVKLTQNPDLAWRIKENARQDIYSTYSRSTYCTRLSRLYHALTAGTLPDQAHVTPDLVATQSVSESPPLTRL
jgi:glycosyltransferase involved in cell wall biosynthesis